MGTATLCPVHCPINLEMEENRHGHRRGHRHRHPRAVHRPYLSGARESND
jgi:hypothetical protein